MDILHSVLSNLCLLACCLAGIGWTFWWGVEKLDGVGCVVTARAERARQIKLRQSDREIMANVLEENRNLEQQVKMLRAELQSRKTVRTVVKAPVSV